MGYNVAGNDNARLFILRNGVNSAGGKPEYLEHASLDSLSQDRGDLTSVESPSPFKYGEFIEVASFSGALSRIGSTLTTYMSQTSLSLFRKLFLDDCPIDIHLHFGLCDDPTEFTSYNKALILTDVRITTYGTDPLVAMVSDDRGVIQENIDITAAQLLEIVPLTYKAVSSAVTTDGPFVKILVRDSKNCGTDCDTPSDGCQRWFAVTNDAVLYSTEDGGVTWASDEITLDGGVTPITDTPTNMVATGEYLLVLTAEGNLYTVSWKDWLEDSTTSWTSVALDANSIDSFYGLVYAVGDSGTAYSISNLADVVPVLNGVLTTENLLAVDVTRYGVLAGGVNGALLYANDSGTNWNVVSSPTTASIVAVLAKSDKNWIIGTATGEVWATENKGATWVRIQYPGWAAASSAVTSLEMATPHIIYLGQNNKVFKSIDGGNTWKTAPEHGSIPFPTMAALNSIATCEDDPNIVMIAGGIGATGGIVKGTISS